MTTPERKQELAALCCEKGRRVCEYMAQGLSSAAAGIAAGYSESYAKKHSHKWVRNSREESEKPAWYDYYMALIETVVQESAMSIEGECKRIIEGFQEIAFGKQGEMYVYEADERIKALKELAKIFKLHGEDTLRVILEGDVNHTVSGSLEAVLNKVIEEGDGTTIGPAHLSTPTQ